MVFICITIGVTPVRRLLRQNWLVRFRRMMGLFAFFYGTLHFVTYFLFDTGLDWGAVVKDVTMRPFITAGFLAWVLMVPLAITSTAGWVRRLGGKRWQKLHYLVYVTAIAAALHYWWLVKADVTVPRRFAVSVAPCRGLFSEEEKRRRSGPRGKECLRQSVREKTRRLSPARRFPQRHWRRQLNQT